LLSGWACAVRSFLDAKRNAIFIGGTEPAS